MIDAFKRFSTLSIKERKEMSNNSRNYALRHLTKKVNLGLVVNEIDKILK